MFQAPINEELELRLFELRHAEALFALIDTNREYLGVWLDWVASTRSVKDSEAFIQRALAQFADNNGWHAGIWLRGQLVGSVGLHYIDWQVGRTEVGYWLAREQQGKGIMRTVIARLCAYFFEEYQLNRVEIRCASENTRSRSIPESLGFKHDGTLRQVALTQGKRVDHLVFSLLKNEWQERKQL